MANTNSPNTARIDLQALGKRIRSLRENRSWSQTDLAKRAGLSQASVSEIERGERTPKVDALVHLADALDESLDFLVFGRERSLEVRESPEAEGIYRDVLRLDDNARELLRGYIRLMLDRRSRTGDHE